MQFGSKQFNFDQRTRQFTADASQLGMRVGSWPFDFSMVSAKTQRAARFSLSESRKNWEGELTERIYRPLDADLDCSVVIFND